MIRFSYFRKFTGTIILLQLFAAALIIGVGLENKLALPTPNLKVFFQPLSLIDLDEKSATKLLKQVNIVMAGQEEEVILATQYLNDVPEKFLLANIRVLEDQPRQVSRASKPTIKEIELPAIVQEKELNKTPPSTYNFNPEHLVMFYCTHSAETYIPDSGKAKLDGERGLINQVADSLAKEVKNLGLQTKFINTIHDYPEYNKSYVNSRATMKEIVKNEKVIAVFDIHRDSILGSTKAYTIDVNNKKSARILIIVGSNERKPHDNWRKNLKFAEKLYDKGEELYPGLIKGVRTHPGTYNQEYHPRSLLLEFGDDQNSLSEAKYASQLFAEILAEVLKEEVD